MKLEFDKKTGLLLPGEHPLKMEEFESHFVYNYKREAIYEGFKKLLKIFIQIRCPRVYVDGSYVTRKPLPNDIDVCWERHEQIGDKMRQLLDLQRICPQLVDFDKEESKAYIKQEFHADVFPANNHETSTGMMFKDYFQKEKYSDKPKGIIYIDLL